MARWEHPQKVWQTLADSENRHERVVGRSLLLGDELKNRLRPRLIGGGNRPPFTVPLTEAEQLAQWQQISADPLTLTHALAGIIEQKGKDDAITYVKAMLRLAERQTPEGGMEETGDHPNPTHALGT